MAAEPLLVVEDLHTHYGQSHVLRGVSFRIGAGEAISLIGRNGMGKTTTLRSLIGLTRPTRGAVRFRGESLIGHPPEAIARRGLAYVPEDRGIFPTLTVRENLVMAARPGASGRVDWTLPRVLDLFPRLAERLAHMGNQLSGGEQQMLTIGRALLTNPDLLLLDEATEGLAPLIRRQIWQVIGQIRAAGVATLIVDKSITTLMRIADRHLIIAKGEIVFEGSTAALAADSEAHRRHLGV
ncbi:MAG: ABC transporter ATP-binding protein [Alphaproteobacteria bacterium]|nr:ABC transporter ATP-binding protein [Alphaproteobacteria bacterium]